MTSDKPSRLSERRLLLGNPYAHIEQLNEASPVELAESDLIRKSRLKLQNQYAYLDDSSDFPGSQPSVSRQRTVKSFEEIERIAVELQKKVWHARNRLWPEGVPQSPVAMLDPSKVCELLGYDFEIADTLGVYSNRPGKVAVAGQIDRRERKILISRDFEPQVQSFTAAHEIGHLLLHPELSVLHRDRGLSGVGVARDRIELEADKFAAYFLLPEKLVLTEFARRFLTRKFSLNEETAFALHGKSVHEFVKPLEGRRSLSRRLASATHYNGRHFYSMAECFNVTAETMAIRLEELSIA